MSGLGVRYTAGSCFLCHISPFLRGLDVLGDLFSLWLAILRPSRLTDDTLGGTLAAKRAWFEQGMTLDIGDLVGNINVPTTVVVGDVDKVENEPGLRRELASRISGTEFIILPGVGHLSPLEAPGELAAAITTATTKMRHRSFDEFDR